MMSDNPAAETGCLTECATSRRPSAMMVKARARLDITSAGNGPSPRRRAARMAAAPTIHHSGWPVSSWIMSEFGFRRFGIYRRVGEQGWIAGPAGLPLTRGRNDRRRGRPASFVGAASRSNPND